MDLPKNIFFFSHNEQIPHWDELAQNLKAAYNYNTILLVLGKSDHTLGQKCKGFNEVIDILPDISSKQQINPLEEDYQHKIATLRNLESRVGQLFIQEDISMDRYFKGSANPEVDLKDYTQSWKHEQTIYFMGAVCEKLEELFKSYQPALIYQETNSAPYRLAWRIAQLYNCKSGYVMLARGWDKRVYFEDGLCLEWNKFREVYNSLDLNNLDADFLEKIRSRHKQITSTKEIPKTYFQFSKKPDGLLKRIAPSRLMQNARNKKHFTEENWMFNPRSVSQELFTYGQKFRRYLRRKASFEYYTQNCRDTFDLAQEYAIYFLHVQPEITVEESAFEYMDQVATIRNIAAALPAGIPLIVREHRPSAGRRPIEFYAELMHIPNVIMLGGDFHSHDLIKNAKVVTTLTGTVAIEAMYYAIPVVVLGSIYFNMCKGVYHPHSISELKKLFNSINDLNGANENDVARFLATSYIASSPGRTFGLGIKEANDAEAMNNSIEFIRSVIES